MILYFIFLPVVMLLFTMFFFCVSMGMLQYEIQNFLNIKKRSFKDGNILKKLCFILIGLVLGVILQSFAISLSVVFVAIATVPAYFIQFFRIIKIIFIWCFKSYDVKSKEIGRHRNINTNIEKDIEDADERV